jgi:hypothetical protein
VDLGALERLIAAVRGLRPSGRVVVFGSSSLLVSFPSESPAKLGVEVTLDVDLFLDPDDEVFRKQLTDVLGEGHEYHRATGYYGDFVDLRLADSFPSGWRDRLVPMPGFEDVFALDPVDIAVSKVAATARSRWALRLGRGGSDRGLKDINTIAGLIQTGRIERSILASRLATMDYEEALMVECGWVMEEILCRVDV